MGGVSYETFIRSASSTRGNGKPIVHLRINRICGSGALNPCGTWYTLGTSNQKLTNAVTGDQTIQVDCQMASWSADTPFTYETSLVWEARTGNAGSLLASQTVAFRITVNALRGCEWNSVVLTKRSECGSPLDPRKWTDAGPDLRLYEVEGYCWTA